MSDTPELEPFTYRGMADLMKSMFGYADFTALANEPLAAVSVSEDKTRITFALASGREVVYETEGDCCSESWVEHLTVPGDLAGAVVTAVGEREMGEFQQDYETIRVYETSFRTDRGDIVIEYRNSSNGYYGGSIRGPIS